MSDMADDLLSGVPMNQVLRDLAARKVATVAMTGRCAAMGRRPSTAAGTPGRCGRS